MKNFGYWLFFFVVTFSHDGFARLGETVAQCEARYGKPIVVSKDCDRVEDRDYKSNGIDISAQFLDGICVFEMFTKEDRSLNITSEEERAIFAKESTPDGRWTADADGTLWTRSDGASAVFAAGALTIQSKQFDKAQKLLSEANAAKSTSGL